MRHRRRRRAYWGWAGSFETTMTDNGGPNQFDAALMIPPGRLKFLAQYGKSDHVTLCRLLMWIDFSIYGNEIESEQFGSIVPIFDMYIIKSTEDISGNAAANFEPYAEPQAPAAIASWDTDIPNDGLDPFLWTCRLYPDTMWSTQLNNGAGSGFNAVNVINDQTAATRVYPKVSNKLFEPDVDLTVKRRFAEDDGLIFGAYKPISSADNVVYRVRASYRVLFT